MASNTRLDEWLTPSYGYMLGNVEVVEEMSSPYQQVQIVRNPTFGLALRLDGAMQCSENDEFFYHEPLVHMPMLHSVHKRRVLIIGGGDGGAAEELLKWPQVELVDHVEVDEAVLRLCAKHLHAVHRGVLSGSDGRYRCHVQDGRAWMEAAAPGSYDVIVLDLTDPGGPSTPLYTSHFYACCSRALATGGVLSLHVAAPWAQLQQCCEMVLTLQRNFAQVTPMLVSVPMSGGQWLMAMASHVAQHPLEEEACGAQLAELRDPALRLITPKVAKSLLALPPYLARALAF